MATSNHIHRRSGDVHRRTNDQNFMLEQGLERIHGGSKFTLLF
jgi:hypothetical protein